MTLPATSRCCQKSCSVPLSDATTALCSIWSKNGPQVAFPPDKYTLVTQQCPAGPTTHAPYGLIPQPHFSSKLMCAGEERPVGLLKQCCQLKCSKNSTENKQTSTEAAPLSTAGLDAAEELKHILCKICWFSFFLFFQQTIKLSWVSYVILCCPRHNPGPQGTHTYTNTLTPFTVSCWLSSNVGSVWRCQDKLHHWSLPWSPLNTRWLLNWQLWAMPHQDKKKMSQISQSIIQSLSQLL